MSAPQNKPVPEVSKLTGIPEATLYLWRQQARRAGSAVPLGEAELAEYCRRRGLFAEQIRRCRAEAQAALSEQESGERAAERAQDKKRIRELEKDLRRKEKALAETAALLVLSRKYGALRTEGEDA